LTAYKIIRFYFDENKPRRVIKRGLTREEAQQHCSLESTHKVLPNGDVVWFDGFESEDK